MEKNMEKSVNVTSNEDLKVKVPDVEIFGEDVWKLVCKASSKEQGWMKSTKAMNLPNGVLIQTSTQIRNANGTYAIQDNLIEIPSVRFENGEFVSMIKDLIVQDFEVKQEANKLIEEKYLAKKKTEGMIATADALPRMK